MTHVCKFGNHCGESHAFPASKLVPKAWTRSAATSTIRQALKHRHNKRVRWYYKQQIRQGS